MPSSHKTKLLGLHSKWCISRFSREFLPHPFGGDQWTIKAPRVVHMLVLKSWCCWVLSVMDLRCMLQLIKKWLSFLPGFFAGNATITFPSKSPSSSNPTKTMGKPMGFAPNLTNQNQVILCRWPVTSMVTVAMQVPSHGNWWKMTQCNGGKGWFASCWMWFHFFSKQDANTPVN